jgi:hypothetical protein
MKHPYMKKGEGRKDGESCWKKRWGMIATLYGVDARAGR